ncbi:hypothetical protein [Escherichia phage phiWec187]|uniref:Uncharacterized protein n=1 Tax=Escherichia phage muut TaxID=2696426 RepID=A0A6B9WJX6_9CAUD|nr:hypothetical protein JR322_gp052 [Escherichia phage muut]QHR65993.1 hypothetical protein muut_196 [Escherichia phage muut]BDU13049.1 hypothetical protein [Escherichia phage phiWec187]HBN5004690.1 hypothetical protein [Escherichia coli]HEH7745996.1 hypothetical protein [Escherichia coli]
MGITLEGQKLIRSGNFLVDVDNNQDYAVEVSDVLFDALQSGFNFEVYEVIRGTKLRETLGSTSDVYSAIWQYFGLMDGKTYLTDSYSEDVVYLDMEEFRRLFKSEENEEEGELFEGIILEGNVEIVYKAGKTFHLRENGKAKVDFVNKTVTTEHNYLKDGQPAFERVKIKFKVLSALVTDQERIDFVEDGVVTHTKVYNI